MRGKYMSVETEVQEITAWCGQTENMGRKVRAVNVLSKTDRDRLGEEKRQIENDIADMSRFRKGDPTQLHKRLGTISDTLEDFSPRPMSAGTRDVLVREEKI